MNPLVGIGLGSLIVIGLAVIFAYDTSTVQAMSGDPSAIAHFIPVAVLAVLAAVILSVATRMR